MSKLNTLMFCSKDKDTAVALCDIVDNMSKKEINGILWGDPSKKLVRIDDTYCIKVRTVLMLYEDFIAAMSVNNQHAILVEVCAIEYYTGDDDAVMYKGLDANTFDCISNGELHDVNEEVLHDMRLTLLLEYFWGDTDYVNEVIV